MVCLMRLGGLILLVRVPASEPLVVYRQAIRIEAPGAAGLGL